MNYVKHVRKSYTDVNNVENLYLMKKDIKNFVILPVLPFIQIQEEKENTL